MRRASILGGFLAVTITVALIAAWLGRASVDHRLGIYAAIALCSPIVLLGVLHELWRARRERLSGKPSRGADFSTFTSILLAMLLGAGLSYPLGWCLWKNDLADAFAFVDRLLPRLEAHRAERQQYPTRIEEVMTPDETLPRLFGSGVANYGTRYLFYEFRISDETSWCAGMCLSSINKSWEDWSGSD